MAAPTFPGGYEAVRGHHGPQAAAAVGPYPAGAPMGWGPCQWQGDVSASACSSTMPVANGGAPFMGGHPAMWGGMQPFDGMSPMARGFDPAAMMQWPTGGHQAGPGAGAAFPMPGAGQGAGMPFPGPGAGPGAGMPFAGPG
eukprot:CAMPEP_0175404660 /NCGR_PEP_ID=MMETSP0095-20121207/38654_1 /TAXON_ID=311494 /ORGANISM="Alexandrium monilatum, Strain CCMP3105" /LENGTH=140 /DNA_ID=CAMNT_0016703479 /DNA_START=30 /DNA_END=449 /DNA_ORIENTATION=+